VKPSESENVTRKKKKKEGEKKKAQSSTRDFIREVQCLYYDMVKKRSRQGPYSGNYKNFQYGLQTYKSKCRNFNSFILLNVVWLFYITFN
jgi:hypothetical protein